MTGDNEHTLSRRTVLGAGVGAAGALAMRRAGLGQALRRADALRDPLRPAGTPDPRLPFDHVVVVMMENHSFDNYFGMLPRRGQPLADGFTFDKHGRPLNWNPLDGGHQYAFHLQGTCQPGSVTQSWNATHRQINRGAMDGFAATSDSAMGYWDRDDLPFYYSLANTFTVSNRWFSSTPCQTYPNRRFLYAGTASGVISTSTSSISKFAPPNGTLMDRLATYEIPWKNYFTDLPATAVIAGNLTRHPANYASIAQFYVDAAAGTLPAVSFVDPDFDLIDEVGSSLNDYLSTAGDLPQVVHNGLARVESIGESEENPSDIRFGEAFVARIVNAVMSGPAWPRTLLVWNYDEHGGYYDHVAPPAAIKPDATPPQLGAGDAPGGYDLYGPRVPAVVVSPYSRRHAVTNVVHDHTSVVAAISEKWNLPALTARDANAATLSDFLDLRAKPAFLEPPRLHPPARPAFGLRRCRTTAPDPVVDN